MNPWSGGALRSLSLILPSIRARSAASSWSSSDSELSTVSDFRGLLVYCGYVERRNPHYGRRARPHLAVSRASVLAPLLGASHPRRDNACGRTTHPQGTP